MNPEEEKYRIHFEPGMHSWFDFQYEDTLRKLLNGDLNAHDWNPQVAERIHQYSPHLIGLDSASAYLDQGTKTLRWTWLPGSPRELCGRDSIFIASGDLLHWQLSDPNAKSDPMLDDLNKIGWDNVGSYARGVAIEGTATITATILASVLLFRRPKEISRRRFLGLSLGLITSVGLALNMGRLTPVLQSYSTSPDQEGMWQFITESTRPLSTKSNWLDGRTALLITKTREAANILELPMGADLSVVMGFPHAYEAGALLRNKQARMAVINKYAQELFQDIFPITQKLNYGEDTEEYKQSVRNILASFLTLSEILEVVEPEGQEELPSLLSTSRFINPVKRFFSKEVTEALVDFGDPHKYFEIIGQD